MTSHDEYARTMFAGFQLPRVVGYPTIYAPAETGGRSLAFRLDAWKRDGKTRGGIGRTTYPNRLRHASRADGFGVYDTDQGETLAGLRAVHASEFLSWIPDGYSPDEYGDGDALRPVVLRLPRGRGFLAGWSMGPGMAATVGYTVYQDETEAARAADAEAEAVAEESREYQESERLDMERAEAEAEAEARALAVQTVRDALAGNAEALAAFQSIAA